MLSFNWVDYVLLIIFLLSIISGLMRGLVKEVMSLVTLVAAFVIAIMFANPLAIKFTSSETVQNAVSHASGASQSVSYIAIAVSFALLFVAVIILGAILSFFLNLALQTGVLGFGNRLFGGVFGVVRGFIVNLVIIFIVQLTPLNAEAWWQDSEIVAAYQPAVTWLGNIVSPSLADLKERFGKTIENVNEKIQHVTGASSKSKAK